MTDAPTTVGMYNRYWTTGGGAETYGAAMARVLARTRHVELLGPEPVSLTELGDRLRLDLSDLSFRTIRDRPLAVTDASHDYDLFVNVSFLSGAPAAPEVESVYVVHFPAELDADLTRTQKAAIRLLGPIVQRTNPIDTAWGEGFYPREGGRPRHFWTNGDGRVRITPDADEDLEVRLVFVRRHPPGTPPVQVAVERDGEPVARLEIGPGATRLDRRRSIPVAVTVPADPTMVDTEIRVRSETFVPAEVLGGDDDRDLGVALTALHIGTGPLDRLGARLGAMFPFLQRTPGDRDFLDSYDHVVCNSEFTRTWLRRWWDHDGEVLHPPVRMHGTGPGDKQPMILAVGRFFGSDSGHSKKQLELVEAFSRLLDRGVEGWSLHLVGGCGEADRDYLESVREAAAGLPVEFHVDAPGEELERLYAEASLFWHATGLGEDPERAPQKLEHFGIATVEAMSAGVVPVIIGVAGQLEIVEDGVNGRHWWSLDQLVDLSAELIHDRDRRAELSVAARDRAQAFSLDAFAERLEAILGP